MFLHFLPLLDHYYANFFHFTTKSQCESVYFLLELFKLQFFMSYIGNVTSIEFKWSLEFNNNPDHLPGS